MTIGTECERFSREMVGAPNISTGFIPVSWHYLLADVAEWMAIHRCPPSAACMRHVWKASLLYTHLYSVHLLVEKAGVAPDVTQVHCAHASKSTGEKTTPALKPMQGSHFSTMTKFHYFSMILPGCFCKFPGTI